MKFMSREVIELLNSDNANYYGRGHGWHVSFWILVHDSQNRFRRHSSGIVAPVINSIDAVATSS